MEQLTLELSQQVPMTFACKRAENIKENYMGLPTGKPWVHLLSMNFRNF